MRLTQENTKSQIGGDNSNGESTQLIKTIIDPENGYLLLWETLISLMTLMTFFVIPLQFCFWQYTDPSEDLEKF